MLLSGHRSTWVTTVLPKSRPFHGISHPEIKQLFKFQIKADPAAKPDGESSGRSGAKNRTIEAKRKIEGKNRKGANQPTNLGRKMSAKAGALS